MSDKLYDILNKIQRWLPFLAIFYVSIASTWGLPFSEEVSKTINAIAALLAGTLEVSCLVYTRKMKIISDAEQNEEFSAVGKGED